MKVEISAHGLSALTRALAEAGGKFDRASTSALKSTGWMVRGVVREHYENLPTSRHMLTRMFRENKAGRWTRRRSEPGMAWFGRFVRYAVADGGSELTVALGRTAKGKSAAGKMDQALLEMALKHEHGRTYAVTERMRRKYAATKTAAAGRRPSKKARRYGLEYFALRKSTRKITVPARPVWNPARIEVTRRATPWFEKKFYKALRRYKVLQ